MTMTGTTPADEVGESSRVRSVTFIRFILRLTEPGAVTVPAVPDPNAPWGRERAHLLADTDPWGRPHLPGTSLAGALREMVAAADGEPAADALFGHLLPAGSGDPGEVDAQASLLWVLVTRPVGADGGELAAVATSVRASTAICRTRAAAKANTLRVEELLPAGTQFEAFLRWDDAPADGLAHLLGLLAAWQPLIGHGTSRGRGRCAVGTSYHGTLRLDDPAGLHQWLTLSGPALARAIATTETAPRAAGPVEPLLRVDVRITGPLRIGTGEPAQEKGGQGQEITPVFRENGQYIVPATGLKGLLRSRAEFILRSVGVTREPCLDQRCGHCWTCRVFGHAGGTDVTKAAVGERALLRVTDATISGPCLVRRQHVAIDRFTGGAAPSLLYTMEALEAGTFALTLEPLAGAVTAEKKAEILAVLRLVLEDLNDGIAGVGAGTARGYGTVTVDLARAEQSGILPSLGAARAQLRTMVAGGTPEEAS